ncbi:MAG: DUF5617 domain-containing protein [Legionella sp.]|nr:DUF5617 domain-containing protein [Legionella sp.]
MELIYQVPFSIMPNELILQIIEGMDLQSATQFMQVNKQLNLLVKNSRLWNQFGAENFTNFFKQMKALDVIARKVIINNNMTFKTYHDLIQINESLYHVRSLKDAEIRQKLFQINPLFGKYKNMEYVLLNNILKGEITFSEIDLIPSFELYTIITRTHWQQALKERLITFDEALLMDPSHLERLITHHGLEALKEKLITKEQALLIAPRYLRLLLTEAGLKAMRAQAINFSLIITPKKANEEGLDPYLMEILKPNGLKLLANNVMTIDDAYSFQFDFINIIVSENVTDALVNTVITLKQLHEAERTLSAYNLKQVFQYRGSYNLLRDNIVTLEQILNLPDKNFLDIICSGGDLEYETVLAYEALRAKVLTFEELYELVMVKKSKWVSLLDVDPKCYHQNIINFDVAAELESNGKLNRFRCAFNVVDKLSRGEIYHFNSIWSHPDNKNNKSKMIAILKDYTKGNILGRFFSGHWNRHFVTEVSIIIRNATQPNVSASDILNQLAAIKTWRRPNSILRKMIDFMEVKYVESLTESNIAEKQQSNSNTDLRLY